MRVEPALAVRKKCLPRHLQGIVRRRAFHHDDMAKDVHLRAPLCDPLEVLLFLCQHDLALCVIDDVSRILGGRGEINPATDAPTIIAAKSMTTHSGLL